MTERIVRIVKLPQMRVAFTHVISETPENDASSALQAWAKVKGIFDDTSRHFFFGYNNPPPSPGKKAYGYECLITIAKCIEPAGDVKVKNIPGGLYAVIRCRGVENLPTTWEFLMEWSDKNGKYNFDEENEPGLEEVLNPLEQDVNELMFDCYLPIME